MLHKTTNKVNAPAVILRSPAPASILLIILMLYLMLAGSPAEASGITNIKVPLKSIAQITITDEGKKLYYPSYVTFDPVEQEIYLTNGGSKQVIVYGPDFFPRISIGRGRGIISPLAATVTSNGEVYICQAENFENPNDKITILNAAFFIDREIYLADIPEAEDLQPRQLAVSSKGVIYLAGTNTRGVIVLDNKGNFLRWLRPMDEVTIRSSELPEKLPDEEEIAPEEDIYADIPEEFRPATSLQESITAEFWQGRGPVKINYVTIDSKGNLYLLSNETSRIYVYDPDEDFMFAFGKKGGSPRQLSQPRSLAIDEKRELIYVLDYMRHTILAYTMTGDFLFEFGGRGFSPGWLNYPNDLAINDKGQLIIADLFNRRVQVLEVGYEAIKVYLQDYLPAEPIQETSDAVESTEQDEHSPGQPESLDDQEITPEVIEQSDSVIEEDIIEEER